MSTINKRFKIGTGLEFADGTTVDTATGLQGYTGSQGDQGNQGDIGYTGSQGNQGDSGYTGSSGMQGATGFIGSQGDIGYTGSAGSNGNDGATGYVGSQGIGFPQLTSTTSNTVGTGSKTFTVNYTAGATGYVVGTYTRIKAIGQSGAMQGQITAYSGTSVTISVDANNITSGTYTNWTIQVGATAGYTGSAGSNGSTGFTGSTGANGNDGATGYAGSQGIQGNQGFTGSKGETGYFGSQGVVGYTGSIGYTGSQGDQGNQGDIGYTGSQGDQGIQGDIGYVGSQGDQGIQGDIGYTGSAGTNGTSVTIVDAVADAAELAAYNTLGLTVGNGIIQEDNGHLQVWNGSGFTDVGQIKGDMGYTGSTGAQGDIGYTGSTGDTGYVGSQGDQGIQGDIGYTGSQGDQGPQGDQGFFGYTGSQGVTGYVGSQGDVGYIGSQGDQGPIGYVGSAGPGADQALDTTSTVTFGSVYIPEGAVATTRTAIDGDSFRVSTFYTNNIDVSSGTVSLSSIAANGYTTVKYLIQATDTNTGVTRVHSQELTCIYANGDLFETEFGIVQTDGTLGEFNNIYSAGNIVLQYVPDASVTKVDLVIYITSIAAY